MDITAVADPAFSSKMMGDGFAIDLTEGEVVAPFDAEVTAAFPTGHAYGLRRKDGVECLIHIGMDTVELNGEGFTSHIKEGQKIKQGDLLMEVDLDFIASQGKPVITPVIFTSGQSITVKKAGQSVEAMEEDIIEIH